jgi:hypothetical protein
MTIVSKPPDLDRGRSRVADIMPLGRSCFVEDVAGMNSISLLSDAQYFDENSTRFAEMRKLLDSKAVKDKLEAMKRLLALMTIGRDVSSFFPDVVKNIVVEVQGNQRLTHSSLFLSQDPDRTGVALQR